MRSVDGTRPYPFYMTIGEGIVSTAGVATHCRRGICGIVISRCPCCSAAVRIIICVCDCKCTAPTVAVGNGIACIVRISITSHNSVCRMSEGSKGNPALSAASIRIQLANISVVKVAGIAGASNRRYRIETGRKGVGVEGRAIIGAANNALCLSIGHDCVKEPDCNTITGKGCMGSSIGDLAHTCTAGCAISQVAKCRRIPLVAVLHILNGGEADLLQVGLAGSTACVFPYFLEDGEKDSGKYRDNRDDDEQFDKCKASGGFGR